MIFSGFLGVAELGGGWGGSTKMVDHTDTHPRDIIQGNSLDRHSAFFCFVDPVI